MISASHRHLYDQGDEPLFGSEVANAFQGAAGDISAAGRCLALAEGTACVFHLMRVAEHGLQHMAAAVGLSREETSLENWKNIIDQIEKKIREIEGLPKSNEKSKRTMELSSCAVQFRYFKDAWRNHVSHAHVTYDERQALSTYNHVREFMYHLATMR